jgi:TolA-binding protein
VEGDLRKDIGVTRGHGFAALLKLRWWLKLFHSGGANVKKLVVIISMLALVMLVGCGKPETPQQKYQKQSTSKIEEMQKNIDKLKGAYDAKAAAMRKKFDEQMAAGKKHYEEALASLKKQEAEAKKELAAMKSATGAAWEKAKGQVDKMINDMEKTYESLKAQLK